MIEVEIFSTKVILFQKVKVCEFFSEIDYELATVPFPDDNLASHTNFFVFT